MDRYDNLELDLECDGEEGGVAHKASVFKGMFKKSTKSNTDHSLHSQDSVSLNRELSTSDDSLTDNNNFKDKSGGFIKGMFKKPKSTKDQTSISITSPELSDSADSLTENKPSKDKALGAPPRPPPKLGHLRRASQDYLDFDHSSDNLTENTTTKDSSGLFGMFKKSPKPTHKTQNDTRRPSQDNLSSSSELSSSQDSLTVHNTKEDLTGELSGSKEDLSDNNNTKEKVGLLSGVFKKPKLGARSQSKDDLNADGELSNSQENLTENNNKEKSGILSGVFKKPKLGARSQSKDAFSADGELSNSQENLTENNNKKETEDQEAKQNDETREEEKHRSVRDKVSQFEQRDRSETILEPNQTSRAKDEVNKEMVSKQKRPPSAETPVVPPRPTKEEMDKAKKTSQNPEENAAKHGRLYPSLPNKSHDEAPNEEKPTEGNENKPVKVKRPKHHNPFMPRTGAKLPAVETAEEAKEDENDETQTQEENKDEEGNDKAEEKAKKPKRRNPFMPQVKNKVGQRRGAEGAENEGGNRTLFDQLEDFRFEPSRPENIQDVEILMEWWDTVENWEDTPQTEDMTPKEEAKAFAVTAEKIQKGIRVFNKLFSERAESLWQHVIDLNGIADGLDKFNKKTKIAQITGGSTSATGGVLTIAGLALAPVTMGTSLIVTAVGLGVATAGGLTSAGAGISNQVNNSMDRKKVEKIVEDYQEKMVDLNKALKFIKQGIEQLRQFDLIKIKKHAYNRDFPVLNSKFYEDGAMAGKAILINANEIMRVVQIANVAGSTAARAVQIASMATGVLTGLFVGMDIYFVAKDSKELKKGAKSEFAAKIREVAQQLHDGLVELNTIREELQATTTPGSNQEGGGQVKEEKKKDEYDDDEEEDEIDRIKKQIKDYENREWI